MLCCASHICDRQQIKLDCVPYMMQCTTHTHTWRYDLGCMSHVAAIKLYAVLAILDKYFKQHLIICSPGVNMSEN